MVAKPILIMGPGCGNPTVEDCPPAHFFILSEEEMTLALNDPTSVATLIGLEAPASVHVGGVGANALTPPDSSAADASESWYCTHFGDSWYCYPVSVIKT